MGKDRTTECQSKGKKSVTLKSMIKKSGLRQDFLAKRLKCTEANISIVSRQKVRKFTPGTVAFRLHKVLKRQINHNNKSFGQKGGTAKA